MNFSDFKLHGISPLYDQVVFVRCHLCQLIIKLPHLVDHLQKRHKITNDSNEETLTELITNEQRQNLILSEEKNAASLKNGKKARSKQNSIVNESNQDSSGNVSKIPNKSRASHGSKKQSNKAGSKTKIDKSFTNEIKKGPLASNSGMPLLTSILDESINNLTSNNSAIIRYPSNDSVNDKKYYIENQKIVNSNSLTSKQSISFKKDLQTSNPTNQENHDSSNNQIRFKNVVEKIKINDLESPSKLSKNKKSHEENLEIYNFSSTDSLLQNDINDCETVNQNMSKNEASIQSENANSTFVRKKVKNKFLKEEKTFNNESRMIPDSISISQPALPNLCLSNNFSMNPCEQLSHPDPFQKASNNIEYEESKFDSPFKAQNFEYNFVNSARHDHNSMNYKVNSNPSSKSSKIYDPNKHCGVVVEEIDSMSGAKIVREPCTRSLTCKKHSISLRRQVTGRCKSFNELFKEYRDEKLSSNQLVNMNKSNNESSITTSFDSSITIPSKNTNGDDCNKRLSTSLSFPLTNYQQNLEIENAKSKLNSSFTDLPEFKTFEKNNSNNNNNSNNPNKDNFNSQHLNLSMNSLDGNKSINEFDFINYQNLQSGPYSQSQDYYLNKMNQHQIQQHERQQHDQNLFQQESHSKIFQPDKYQYSSLMSNKQYEINNQNLDNQSIFKLFLTGVPLNSSNHTVNNSDNSYLMQSPSVKNSNSARPLGYNEISQQLNLNYLNKMLVKHHPRPSAITSFNGRITDNGGGYTLWDRKQDNLRLLLSNAFSQTENLLNKNVITNIDGESTTPSKTNVKCEPPQESNTKDFSKQDVKLKQSQSNNNHHEKMSKNEVANSTNNNFSGSNQPKQSKIKSNSKKRNSEMPQHQQGFSSSSTTMSYALKDSISNCVPAKFSKLNNEVPIIQNNDYMDKFPSMIESSSMKNFSMNELASSFLNNGNYTNERNNGVQDSILDNENRKEEKKAKLLNERIMRDDSLMLNGNCNTNKKSDNEYGKSGLNTFYKYSLNTNISQNPSNNNQQHSDRNFLLEDHEVDMNRDNPSTQFSMMNSNYTNPNAMNKDFFESSKFASYATNKQMKDNMIEKSNGNPRQALKSISLSPSPSSSSSASNSSTLANGSQPMFNTIN